MSSTRITTADEDRARVDIARDDDAPCSARQHVWHELVAVEPIAANGYEAIARFERPRIDRNAGR